ncbi:MAG: Phosphoribosyltransferase [Synergistales bacterium 58_81]|nr:MAG: Phosphoribosyltransferase [Synergistales bacterium 57_84]KUK88949.1 MAG: Phosphoribosyltransferase [Synergistales bacterium 58_81]
MHWGECDMKSTRTERLIRMASRFLTLPSRQISLTEMSEQFEVSKTVISDDVTIIDKAFREEDLGAMSVGRGRSGGASFRPGFSGNFRSSFLASIAGILSSTDRILPGMLIHYSDILFNPGYARPLGYALASDFADREPDVVMTSEVKGIPLAIFTAHALGIPMAVCRFRNRPSDGPAVAVHYPSGSGEVRTMFMGTRFLSSGKRVLVIDDFMRGGSTAAGMLLVAKEFGAEVIGTGIFIAASEPARKAVSEYRALLRLERGADGVPIVKVQL